MKLLGTLGFDWKIFLIQAVNFLVLFLILKKIFFRPFIETLRKEKVQQERLRRAEEIIEREKLEWAREKTQEIKVMQEKIKNIVTEAEMMAQKMEERNEERITLKEQEALNKVKQRARAIAQHYKKEIKKEYRENMNKQLTKFFRQEFSSVTLNYLQDSFWKGWISNIKSMEIDDSLLSVDKDRSELAVKVFSAFPLTSKQKNELKEIIREKIKVKKIILTNPEKKNLLAGFRVIIAGLLVEKNLRNDLQKLVF